MTDTISMAELPAIVLRLASLPPESLLADCWTEDLQYFWFELKQIYQLYADYFHLRLTTQNISSADTLAFFTQAGNQQKISKRVRSLYALDAERLFQEWQLIELAFPDFLATARDLPQQSCEAFFGDLLIEDIAQEIQLRATEFYEINRTQRVERFSAIFQADKSITDPQSSAPQGRTSQSDLLPEVVVRPTDAVVINAGRVRFFTFCQQQGIYESRLQDLNQRCATYGSTLVEEFETRGNQGYLLKTEAWIKGVRYLRGQSQLNPASLKAKLAAELPQSAFAQIEQTLEALSEQVKRKMAIAHASVIEACQRSLAQARITTAPSDKNNN